MFARFSSGYYLGRLYVQPHDGDRPVMHREQHDHVTGQLYGDEPVETWLEGSDDGSVAIDRPAEADPMEPSGRLPGAENRDEREAPDESERPLVMKIGGAHVPVHGEAGIPEQTVALPGDWLAATRVKNPPTLTEVLLAKRDRVDQLLKVAEESRSART
ncbi:DUF5802 family protein [Haloglomus litoreum]|uniref:DUF5802 family protein n=1 Tax=Haloglomus litoreum TaxID=3034026 RepID=UPI0023E8442C|nr:DUF5802 family protein [Haloglomus sp. DT116]